MRVTDPPPEADDPARFRILWTTDGEAQLVLLLAGLGRLARHEDLVTGLRARVAEAKNTDRGRLWDAGPLPFRQVVPVTAWSGPIAARILWLGYGGLIFHQALAGQARRLPGFVTRMDLTLA